MHKSFTVDPGNRHRIVDVGYFVGVARYLRHVMEEPVFHVYSQTPSTASGASARYAEEIHAQFGTTDVHVHLDSLTIPTFHAFVHADALVLSVSDFSYTAAILRTAGPVIYFPFWFLPLKSWCVALKSESDVIPTGGLTKKALSVPSNSSACKPLLDGRRSSWAAARTSTWRGATFSQARRKAMGCPSPASQPPRAPAAVEEPAWRS